MLYEITFCSIFKAPKIYLKARGINEASKKALLILERLNSKKSLTITANTLVLESKAFNEESLDVHRRITTFNSKHEDNTIKLTYPSRTLRSFSCI